MSHQPFTAPTTNPILTQPSTAVLYARSTSVNDTSDVHIRSNFYGNVTFTLGPIETILVDDYTGATITSAEIEFSPEGTISIFQPGTAGRGKISVCSLPANNDTLRLGQSYSDDRTYTFKTTLTGASNQILIAGSVDDQATYIYEAINAGANSGTHYGTGTTAHSDLVASVPVGNDVTITDVLLCNRIGGWVCSQSVGATLTLVAPVGGVDGTVLLNLTDSERSAYNTIILDTEDLSIQTLPADTAPTTDWIQLNGKACTLRFKCSGVSDDPLELKYQTSIDGVNASNGVTAIANVDGAYNVNPLYVYPTERCIEYIRLVFTLNDNTEDTALDARVIFPLI